MPYFAIRETMDNNKDVCICQEERIEDVNPTLVLGEGEWEIREISEDEANQFADEWWNGQYIIEDRCPICGGPRVRELLGELVVLKCRDCEP